MAVPPPRSADGTVPQTNCPEHAHARPPGNPAFYLFILFLRVVQMSGKAVGHHRRQLRLDQRLDIIYKSGRYIISGGLPRHLTLNDLMRGGSEKK